MSLTIPDEIIKSTRMSTVEIIQELAIVLFQKEKLTLGQASSLAKMNQLQFQHLLASRQIPIHYSKNDFEQDIETLKELRRL
jgi:predicted HTH domain antitoxin